MTNGYYVPVEKVREALDKMFEDGLIDSESKVELLKLKILAESVYIRVAE